MLNAIRRFFPKYIRAIAGSLFLFSVGVFSRRHRFMIFQIAEHFGMRLPVNRQTIPAVSLTSVLGNRLDLDLREPLANAGNVTLLELLVISSMAREANPPQTFEIGTFDGRTTLNIAANLSPEGHAYTLDLPRSDLGKTRFAIEAGEKAFVSKEDSGSRFRETEFATKITQLYGDSATFDFSSYEGRMGLVFVDGSHTEEYLRHDSATALRLVADGGVILWHDYQQDRPGVIAGLNHLYETNPAFAASRKIEGTTLVMLKCEDSRR